MFSEMLEITNTEGLSFATASNVYKVYEIDHDSDIFEGVIDGLILEKYADQDLKDYIKDLPSNKKRVAALLSIGDDNVLWSKINEIIKEEKSGYQRLKAVYTLLKEYVKILDVERKKHGEILTPFKELAEPMVKLVEKYDSEFWKNKNHKVLDSSAGYGTFLILAAYKFMVGLKGIIEDEEERFKWIVENCLYYGELQAKSVFSWLVAIDPHNEYKTNIYWGNFLTEDFDRHINLVWNVEKFDLIIQNPPYQEQKPGFKKSQPLWHSFVQKSLTLLKDDKYMVMVHPSGWRNVDGAFKSTQNLLKSKQILELKMHGFKDGIETFGAQIAYDYYCVKNSDNEDDIKTNIICLDGEICSFNLSKLDFIPGENIIEIQSLVAKPDEERVEVLYSRSAYGTDKPNMSKEKTEEFKYPCIYTIVKGGRVNYFWSNVNNRGHFNHPKVIWSNGSATIPIIDTNGDYGITQFSYAIIDDKENLDNIKKALLNDYFKNKIMLFKGLADIYNYKIIATFRKDFWKEFI
jgi:hypothetical protein